MHFPKSTALDFEEWKVERAFTFTNGTGRPLLESARLQGDDANATVVDALAVGGSNARLSPLPSSAAQVQKVGPATARELAGKQTSGSRANALAAYDSKWYYGSFSFTTSYTWEGARNYYWFARGSGRATHLSNVWYMLASDVLQLDFDRDGNISHSMIVTAVGSNGKRYLTYHT